MKIYFFFNFASFNIFMHFILKQLILKHAINNFVFYFLNTILLKLNTVITTIKKKNFKTFLSVLDCNFIVKTLCLFFQTHFVNKTHTLF